MTLPDFPHEGQALPSNHADDKFSEALAEPPAQTKQASAADATSQTAQLVQQVNASARKTWLGVQSITAQLANKTDTAKPQQRVGQLLSLTGGAIAVLLLLILGWNNHQLKRSLATQAQELAQANATIDDLEQQRTAVSTALTNLANPQSAYALRGEGELANAAGSVVTIADENKAFLVTPDLPSLPEEQVYRFWATTDSQDRLMYCGQFTIGQAQFVEWSLPVPACARQATQALITIDPITASTASEGEVVLRSQSVPAAE